jgi:hypothetical protein
MKAVLTAALEVARRKHRLQYGPRLLVFRCVVGDSARKNRRLVAAKGASDLIGDEFVIVPLLSC